MNAIIHKIEKSAFNSVAEKDNSHTAIGLVKYYTTTVNGPFKSDPHLYRVVSDNPVDPKKIDLYTNERGSVIEIYGANGVVKIYNEKGSLVLIATAIDAVTKFTIAQLKKGQYFIEAEKTFFEFVK